MAARRVFLAVALLVACGLAGCAAGAVAARRAAPSITVLAAASLNAAFTGASAELRSSGAPFTLQLSFAGSQQLVQSVIDGAPGDVVATADAETMQRLVAQNLVEQPRVFARNQLEIAVATANPKHIRTLADLARADVSTVLAAPDVPAGAYAATALRKARVTVHPVSLELDVVAALEQVESGDADAAVVYTTDVAAAGGRVAGVPISAADNVRATYLVAALRSSAAIANARAFVTSCVSGVVQAAMRRQGFLPP